MPTRARSAYSPFDDRRASRDRRRRSSLALDDLLRASDRLIERSRQLQERAGQLSKQFAKLNEECLLKFGR